MRFLNSAISFLLVCFINNANAQPNRWQQHVKYQMDVNLNVETNKLNGKQKIAYTNNSPETLKKIYYHLYWNAFQPNSCMDVRSRNLPDPDGRVKDRISKLTETEIGYQKIANVKVNGTAQKFKISETILEVFLSKPILPKSTTILELDFEAQVPIQIRRSGRDNAEGVRYSMSQWYPKLCEYDYEGWHPTPYVAREFYGVWGDFEVNITIDKNYTIGGTGYLKNNNQIGKGYEDDGVIVKDSKNNQLLWKFFAPNVHDFVWAADNNYAHKKKKLANGTTLHVLYKNDAPNKLDWEKIPEAASTVLPFIEKNFGKYPYQQYSFIQGGDGGMEYPMATLLKGPGLGTVFHEWMHTWYQMILGTNESLYAWMDEGFTSYAEEKVSDFYNQTMGIIKPVQEGQNILPLLQADLYAGYFALAKSGKEEPLTTHADHFNSNRAYSLAAYTKGAVFLNQLGYIIGDETRDRVLLSYYNQWKFKHPNASDFVKLAQQESGIQLDWYAQYFINSTKTIDYAIDSFWEENLQTKIKLKKVGFMPMPIDLDFTFKNGLKEQHYIPLNLMFATKPNETNIKRVEEEPWRWTHPTYIVTINNSLKDISKIEIDATQRMADVDRKNNVVNF